VTRVREIQAKVLLSHVKQPDTWFGLRYNMNLYRGCQHGCIYCDSRSECYQIEDFDGEVLVKANAIELLRRELASKRVKGPIGMGSMNDSYMPVERRLNITGQALRVIAEFGFPVHVMTKSSLVLRDLDVLRQINERYAAVSFTITTADDALGRKVEPRAALVSDRFRAMRVLADNNILTGISMMPILPFIEDTTENIEQIVELARENGASYIIPGFGMTLRDRQRAYYYNKLDELFPGLRQRYERAFGGRYGASGDNTAELERVFHDLCHRYGIKTRMVQYEPVRTAQMRLL
jgi:DNA repair photolyase